MILAETAMKLLEVVCKKYPYKLCQEGIIQDKNGDTPYHIVMERKRSPNTIKICKILSEYPINPTPANKQGKKPGEGRTKQDERYSIVEKAADRFQTKESSKKSGKKKKKSKAISKTQTLVGGNFAERLHKPHQVEDTSNLPAELDIHDDIQNLLLQLKSKPQSYFEPPKKTQSAPVTAQPIGADSAAAAPPANKEHETSSVTTEHSNNDKKEVDFVDIVKNFDNDCSWEVECTDRVKKFFANSKIPRGEKERAVKTIRKLADGIPLNNPKLSKPVRSHSKEVLSHSKEARSHSKLFESRYTKGSRILFEVAIQFSPRLSSEKKYMYSEVIRLWDIVRDHDKLNQSIDHVVECIEKSQQRGEKAAIRIPLVMGNGQKSRQCTPGQEQVRLPQYYICNKEKPSAKPAEALKFHPAEALKFLPAGSTRDDEYNVITFYSFDSSFIKSMLSGDGARRDFPFKEWPKEHDIINMPQGKVSILLLGRSGTGKTTCCLYRLWNQFQTYWAQAITSGPLIPHRPLAILQNKETVDPDDYDNQENEDSDVICNTSEDSHVDELSAPTPVHTSQEHFHQVFITKNYVLCAQMKKRFYDLAAGREIAKDHMKFEDADIPTSLSNVNDLAYPLFLTARQFFVLLDNSLQDGKPFFIRDEEGKIKEKILSSDYDHENPDTLLDLEESDSEGEIDGLNDEHIEQLMPASKEKKIPRKEVTASYFAEKIWPKICRGVTLHDAKIDPLLVWMEIKSFIKGSMQAVDKEEGYLSQEEYEKLGKKMAPNYEDRRQDIYKIFILYKDYIQNHKIEDNIFDECDLNFNLSSRLNALKDLPWSIHSIYIDEVQDFTQAELSILIRICRDPNNLFLTGDTAQSIMRGISFRFADLKSIFYRASKQVSRSVKSAPVKVPQVDQLTINFRSHTGILMLAASIIDLLKHFFLNSFDCLPGDEGMFPGPTPVVLDSCNVSDLALVLRTNKRDSSVIEFGAHQVIIVQSEEAKKNIPDMLKAGIVLTVFESKGLEFDDVLLYNFFKDSKVLNIILYLSNIN